MKIKRKRIPRKFYVGNRIKLKHMANITLLENEMITLISDNENEFDIVYKGWGYYATPSYNKRLVKFNFLTCICENSEGHRFIHIVNRHKLKEYNFYCETNRLKVVSWLD